jgi:hypothetical protein
MGCAQLAQRGGVATELLVHSSHIIGTRFLAFRSDVARLRDRKSDQQRGVQLQARWSDN